MRSSGWPCLAVARTSIRRFCSDTATSTQKDAPTKKKDALLTRIGNNIKRMIEDYKLAAVETASVMKERPMRSGVYLCTAGAFIYSFNHNPTLKDYEKHLVKMTNDLSEVSDLVRNQEKSDNVQSLVQIHNEGRLRRLTLGACSLIWISEYAEFSGLYEAKWWADETKWRTRFGWKDFPSKVVDIGFLDRWWWAEKCMIDFDINPKEWEHLDKANKK